MKVRINNIECRECVGKRDYEIIKWQPCRYYEKKQEYLDNGYEESNDFLTKDGVYIALSFFNMTETCYVVAWLKKDKEGGTNMETVGIRPLKLRKKDFKDIIKVWGIVNELA